MLISTLGHVHVLAAPDPLVAPTWATAIATIILAAGAILTAVLAFLAFRKQTAELVILQEQAKVDQEDRRHEATERRRERAAMVYLTVAFDKGLRDNPEVIMVSREPSVTATVHNSGKQPVYDVRVHWVDASSGVQAGAEDKLATIAPSIKKTPGEPCPPAPPSRRSSRSRTSATPRASGGPCSTTASPMKSTLPTPRALRSSRRQPSQGPRRERERRRCSVRH